MTLPVQGTGVVDGPQVEEFPAADNASFPLRATPAASTLQVSVAVGDEDFEIAETGWVYDSALNEVIFALGVVPPEASVRIEYELLDGCP